MQTEIAKGKAGGAVTPSDLGKAVTGRPVEPHQPGPGILNFVTAFESMPAPFVPVVAP